MLAEVGAQAEQQGLKLNHPEAVAVISAAALDAARAGKTLEEVMTGPPGRANADHHQA